MQADWRQVRDLFERALDEQPADLIAWLDREAGDQSQVRAEVLSLLRHHTHAGSFLVEPAAVQLIERGSEAPPLESGQVVGPYTIVRELGRGGMGRVYLATDMRLGRSVALKALVPELTDDPGQRERLRREARAAAALTHPGICTVYALEEFDGELYIVSEFVDGHTLREEIGRRRTPSAGDIADTARQIASALASAHARGITHRDLKPDNVMRGADGRLKILDFGLARIDVPSSDPRAVHATQPGAVMGTPGYMAPEQLNGQPADARTDVFAFGVTMYEFACGTHPFAAATPLGIAARVLESDAQPLEARCPHLPLSLAATIERCLSKSPEERFHSAAELVSALARDDARSPKKVASWWRTHQFIATGLYLIASGLSWLIKEWIGGPAAPLFVAVAVAATVGAVFRGHLVFTERVNRGRLASERRRAAPVTLVVDLMIAAALAGDGALLAGERTLAATLTIALGVGVALARLILEPSTTAAAFDSQGP
jgi:serine/threonine protein kinase